MEQDKFINNTNRILPIISICPINHYKSNNLNLTSKKKKNIGNKEIIFQDILNEAIRRS